MPVSLQMATPVRVPAHGPSSGIFSLACPVAAQELSIASERSISSTTDPLAPASNSLPSDMKAPNFQEELQRFALASEDSTKTAEASTAVDTPSTAVETLPKELPQVQASPSK